MSESFASSRPRLPRRGALRLVLTACLVLAGLTVLTPAPAPAITLPAKFTHTRFATGLDRATAMQFAPDGRLFVSSQKGVVYVVKNGVTLPTPFVTVATNDIQERGLTGIVLDPSFATNHYVYVYYASLQPDGKYHNKVSRFEANGDVAKTNPGGTPIETTILMLEALGDNIHNSGAMNFGPDGKLYISTGDNASPSNAQKLTNKLGKILRINKDGSVPSDNPFVNTVGASPEIWALGFRNPFTFAIQPGTGRLFANDVGNNTWEEVDDVVKGANYGWPTTEGAFNQATYPQFHEPLYAYRHDTAADPNACAVTGGTFYNPPAASFPSQYVGKYFFADYCSFWIKVLDPATGQVTNFAQMSTPYDINIQVGPGGDLYYLSRTAKEVWRISYTGSTAPGIETQPESQTVSVGDPVTFSVESSGSAPLSYQWKRDGNPISGATQSTYSLPTTTLADNGAKFSVVVTNGSGTATSDIATLTVQNNLPPHATITTPPSGTFYSGGDTLHFAGTGTDPEDGTLPASAYTWQIDLHHDTHEHPAMPPTTGITSGDFAIPDSGHTESTVFYRVTLTVQDSLGRTDTTYVDVQPNKVKLTLATNVPGLKLNLDGQPQSTPYTEDSVVGIKREIGAITQTVNGKTYQFVSWSDGGAATHLVATPTTDTTYTATYKEVAGAPTTVKLTPTADSYANSGAKTTNFGTSASLCARGATVAPAVSYLRFVLPAAPAGKTLTGVSLKYRTTTLTSAGSKVAQTVALADDTWTETGLTWNNRPTVRTALGSTPANTVPNAVYAATLSPSVLSPKLGTTVSMAVSGTGDDNTWFWSRNHANATYRPELTLTYN